MIHVMLTLPASQNWCFFVMNCTRNSISPAERYSPSRFANLLQCNGDPPSWESQICWVSTAWWAWPPCRVQDGSLLFLPIGSFHTALTNFVGELNHLSNASPGPPFQALRYLNKASSSIDVGAGRSSVLHWGTSRKSKAVVRTGTAGFASVHGHCLTLQSTSVWKQLVAALRRPDWWAYFWKYCG